MLSFQLPEADVDLPSHELFAKAICVLEYFTKSTPCMVWVRAFPNSWRPIGQDLRLTIVSTDDDGQRNGTARPINVPTTQTGRRTKDP